MRGKLQVFYSQTPRVSLETPVSYQRPIDFHRRPTDFLLKLSYFIEDRFVFIGDLGFYRRPPCFEMSEIKESGIISKFGGLLQYTLKAEDTWGSPVKIWRAVLKMESAVKYCFVPPTKISWSPMMLRVSRENLGVSDETVFDINSMMIISSQTQDIKE